MFRTYQRPDSYLAQVRNVPLIDGERVTRIFSPEEGIVQEPTSSGRLLLATSHRIISFDDGQGNQETLVMPIEELTGVMVRSRSRSSISLVQGLIFIFSGLIIYFAVSYWLTSRFSGPQLPVINIDLGPLLVLLGLLGGGWLVGKHYLTREGGVVTFQGNNWTFAFPYSGDKAAEDVQDVVKAVFTTRSSRNGYFPPSPG